MSSKEKITVWLDNDGVIKDDVEAAFAKKGFGPMDAQQVVAKRFVYNAFKEMLFVSLHLRMSSSAKSLSWDALPPREGVVKKAQKWVEEGALHGKEVSIGIITSNPDVSFEKLKGLFNAAGIKPDAVRVSGNMKKGAYLNSLPGENVLVDDNYFSFLRLDTRKNKGIALKTDYTNIMRKYITKLKGVYGADNIEEVDEKILGMIRK